MKNLFFLLIACFISFPSFGQTGGGGRVLTPPSTAGQSNGLISSNHRYGSKAGGGEISYELALEEYKTIQGSPFLNNGEMVVDLIYYNDSLLKEVTILYDLYNKEMIVKNKDGEIIILDQVYYKGFNFENEGKAETYRRVPLEELKFHQILFQNEDFAFSKDIKVTLKKDNSYIPGQTGITKKFNRSYDYYIIDKENTNPVKLRKEALVEHLPQKYKSQVAALKKKLKIKKLNKEKDYVLLMESFGKK